MSLVFAMLRKQGHISVPWWWCSGRGACGSGGSGGGGGDSDGDSGGGGDIRIVACILKYAYVCIH